MDYYKGHPSYGGFFPDNVRKWLIKECLESGDPESMLSVISDVVNDLYDYINIDELTTWEKLEEEVYGK